MTFLTSDFFFSLIWVLLIIKSIGAVPITSKGSDDCILQESGVYVSLSSEAEFEHRTPIRWVEIHWWGAQVQSEDYIGIWDQPITSSEGFLDSAPVTVSDGMMQTIIRWNGSLFPTEMPATSECLAYWAGYVQNGSVIYNSCLRLQPYWMEEHQQQLSYVGIAEVALPGVHDAGAYGSPDLLIRGNDEVGKWTFTQDETLWQNMVLGVRYFDMRISYYMNTEEIFFVNHGDVRIRPLEGYLNQTANFLGATNEIIVFDIHGLEHNLSNNVTAQIMLQDLIESYLGDFMAPNYYGLDARLETFWLTGKRLIVTFPASTERTLYWPTVNHLWGNVNDLDDLYDYFSTNIPLQVGAGAMWSSMTELTPNAVDVTLNHWKGLRGAANITNSPVTLWLRREWWTMVNVIAMDYIGSSDVIATVIETNIMRDACNITIS